jgi:hypothetical protein
MAALPIGLDDLQLKPGRGHTDILRGLENYRD